MNRRQLLKIAAGAGGCGAAALLAGHCLLPTTTAQRSAEKSGPAKHRFGLFDVDCRELNTAGDGLQLRPRVEPLADRLNRLYAFSEGRKAPLVFTTCCSGRMLRPDSLPQVLVVPLDPAQQQWQERLDSHRMVYLEKKGYSEGTANFQCRAYDMFQDNGNAAQLVQVLDVDEWVVFGNGFDLCINSAVRGLVAAGQKVCLLSDVYARGSRGYYVATPQGQFECGTASNQARILADFEQLGVRTLTLEQFLASA